MPARVQRKRTPGWRMPGNAVYVGRPTKWGNPYYVEREGDMRRWTGWYVGEIGRSGESFGSFVAKHDALKQAVDLYELHTGPMGSHELDVDDVRRELGGKDLCCWCPPDQPCHADVLLRIANPTTDPKEASCPL